MQYKKPPREVKHGYGGSGIEYFSLVILIACFTMIVNLILAII